MLVGQEWAYAEATGDGFRPHDETRMLQHGATMRGARDVKTRASHAIGASRRSGERERVDLRRGCGKRDSGAAVCLAVRQDYDLAVSVHSGRVADALTEQRHPDPDRRTATDRWTT